MLRNLDRLPRHAGRLLQRQYSSTPENLPSSVFLRSFMDTAKVGPVQQTIEAKLQEAFSPSILDIVNESHLHAHHEAMKGNTDKETHFRYNLMQRHRSIYTLLSDELQAGVHALSLKTKTPQEIEKSS
ncbi:bola protein [Umbelopsis sp. PMI_123]|nr:bola protein [Umbelopsis sp. PMI_123]